MMEQWSSQMNDGAKMANKPMLIAICGKSAAGKDTLANELYKVFKENNIPVRRLINDTTRPPRPNEVQHVDYNFISPQEFQHNITLERYLEYAQFREWYYGTNKFQIDNEAINIGVFNPQGIIALTELQNFYKVFVVYINAGFRERIHRTKEREGHLHPESIRRAIADSRDFHDFDKYITNNFRWRAIFKHDESISHMCWYIYSKVKFHALWLRMGKVE